MNRTLNDALTVRCGPHAWTVDVTVDVSRVPERLQGQAIQVVQDVLYHTVDMTDQVVDDERETKAATVLAAVICATVLMVVGSVC